MLRVSSAPAALELNTVARRHGFFMQGIGERKRLAAYAFAHLLIRTLVNLSCSTLHRRCRLWVTKQKSRSFHSGFLRWPTRIRTSTNRTKTCRTTIILWANPTPCSLSALRECKNKVWKHSPQMLLNEIIQSGVFQPLYPGGGYFFGTFKRLKPPIS